MLRLRAVALHDDQVQRWAHAAAVVGSRAVLFGGLGGPKHQRLDDVWTLDMVGAVDEWRWRAQSTVGEGPSKRMHHSAVAIGAELWVFGGRNSPAQPYNDLHAIDVAASPPRWCRLCGNSEKGEGENSPCPRWRHAAASVRVGGADAMAVFGGRDAEALVAPELFLFTASSSGSRGWRRCGLDGPIAARHSHNLVAWGEGTLLVVGGADAEMRPLDGVVSVRLGGSGGEPARVGPLELRPPLPGRLSAAACVEGDRLFVLGGCTDRLLGWGRALAVVELGGRTWRYLRMEEPDPRGCGALWINHAAFAAAGSLVVAGGGGTCFSFGTHFDPALAVYPLPEPPTETATEAATEAAPGEATPAEATHGDEPCAHAACLGAAAAALAFAQHWLVRGVS